MNSKWITKYKQVFYGSRQIDSDVHIEKTHK